jgi:hypothetical protein
MTYDNSHSGSWSQVRLLLDSLNLVYIENPPYNPTEVKKTFTLWYSRLGTDGKSGVSIPSFSAPSIC